MRQMWLFTISHTPHTDLCCHLCLILVLQYKVIIVIVSNDL